MSLNANDLKELIKENLKDATDAESANKILGDTISEYILDNAQFSFSWIAQLASIPFTSDPIIITTGEFISLLITIEPSGATNATDANKYLRDQIVLGMQSATYNITASGFSTSPGSMSSAPTIQNLSLTPGGETDGEVALLDKCQKIITWVKQLKPTAPCSGSHGSYVGAGTVTSII